MGASSCLLHCFQRTLHIYLVIVGQAVEFLSFSVTTGGIADSGIRLSPGTRGFVKGLGALPITLKLGDVTQIVQGERILRISLISL